MPSPAGRDTTADISDPVTHALEELPDILGSHLRTLTDLLETLDRRQGPFLQLGAGPLRRALQASPRLLERLAGVLPSFLGLVRCLVPGLGQLVVHFGEYLLQIVSRLDGAGLDTTPELVQVGPGLDDAGLN